MRNPENILHISYPCGVAISQEGHLVVAEWSRDCITILDTTSGEKIDELCQYGPEGVAITQDGHIIVVDSCNHRLQVLTVEGTFVAAVGSQGSQPLQFDDPYDIAVHDNDGKIFVTEIYKRSCPGPSILI